MRRLLVLAGLLCVPVVAAGEDWPHWRGLNRSGVVSEPSGYRDGKWLANAPAWTANVGEGSTSPLVVGGKLYTLGWRDGKDVVRCLDAVSGKEVWSASYRSPQYGRFHVGDEGIYGGTCSTPEYDPATGLLYTLGIDGDLHCWDTRAAGRKVWGLNLYDQFKVARRPKVGRQALRDYGYTSSPLLAGDDLLVEVGSKEGNLIALDPRTGQKRWASACKDPAGHNAGPAPVTVQGVPCAAVLTIHRLVVVRLDRGHQGETVAEYPWETDFANNIAGPAVHGDCVLLTSAYNHNAICKVRLTLRGAEKVWQAPYASKVCTPVVHEGHIYWAWRTVKCLDWETGKLKWEGGGFGDAGSCVVTADGRLVVFGEKGKLALVETAKRSPDRYTQLAVKDRLFREIAWPHVVLSGGRVYCKDRYGNLACFPPEP
jgi:outer membrane protein assembly factor BamB